VTIPRSLHRRRRLPIAGAAALGALALLTLWAAPAGALPAATHALAHPYSSYSTGRVDVILPSALPDVELQDAQNASVGAGLSVDQILEVVPSMPTPQVVAVAFPSGLSAFNSSAPSGASTLPISLTATLQVYPADAALWAGPGATVTPDGGPLGVAHLAINYSLPSSPAPSTGVAIAWTVTSWPWQHASDLLGVQLGLTTQGGNGLTACGGSPPLAAASRCPGTPLRSGEAVWGSPYVALEGEGATAPTASVTWGPTATTAAGARVPVTAGALGQTGSYGHLFLGASADGSPVVQGSISFSLLNPSFAAAPFLLHGEVGWYAASAAASAAAGLIAVVAYRRHNRSIESSL
jgi:hypothetical protein